jgi:hypothetical protein
MLFNEFTNGIFEQIGSVKQCWTISEPFIFKARVYKPYEVNNKPINKEDTQLRIEEVRQYTSIKLTEFVTDQGY